MFQNCGLTQVVRAAAPVAAPVSVLPGYVGDQNTGGFYWVCRTQFYGAGNCEMRAVGSFDGGVTYINLGEDLVKTISSNGYTYINLDGPIPSYVGLRLTPDVAFAASSAQVEVRAYSSGRLLFDF